MRSQAQRCAGVAFAGFMLTLLTAGSVAAHGGGNVHVRAAIGPLPAALAGMRIEVHKTISPQLVIENTTRRTLEVLDDSGVAFLRIGPHGVEGNVAARAWYATYSPGAVAPATAGDGTPRWARVSATPAFGWFDPRLDDTRVTVPHRVIDSALATTVGRWTVPLRIDGKRVSLAGSFRYEPPPAGTYVSRLTSPSQIAPGVRVTLIPGHPPGLLVENASPRLLTVLGADGEQFLRIGPQGVEANVRSRAWLQGGRSGSRRGRVDDPAVPPEWQRVGAAARFSWIEPRAAGPAALATRTSVATDVREWQVPMRLGDEAVRVTGVVAWKLLAAGAAP